MLLRRATILGFCLALALTQPAGGSVPTDPAARAKVVGQPASILVQPATILLNGPRAQQQLVVTGKYADGTVRDLSAFADITLEGDAVAVSGEQVVLPKKNGTATVVIKAGGQMVKAAVNVKDFDKASPVSFRNDVIAALNVGGCNSGACHGTPSGKNGFKLSLRGYDPPADFIQLTRDVLGRRTERQGPNSLIIMKSLGRIPHEGGSRFPASSVPAQALTSWLAEGLQDDSPTLPEVKKVEVLPGARTLNDPSRWQQLAVQATFSNGETRDVTRLTVFTSSDPAIAGVTPDGLVEFNQAGEVAILCRYLMELVPVRLTYLEPKPGFKWSDPKPNNYIDTHAFAKMKLLNIQPSDVCTDQEFIRRATMDLCGVLPTPEETKKFMDSKDANKRAKLVDELLERPEYADLWTLKWSDVFRSNRKTIQQKGTHVFQKWLRNHIDGNTPLSSVIHDVITASGSTFANPPANYYRIAKEPTALAETTAQLFFGIRMQCAKCHNHPFERWTQDDYYSFAAFFARVKGRKDAIEPGTAPNVGGAEYIYTERAGEVNQPRTGKNMEPKFMGGPIAKVAPGKDRREALAAWMTSAENPLVPKSLVNRIWYHLLGRGIVDPVDDFRDSNPSANDELLDALARDFTAKGFDVKHLIRQVMNSKTYQLSAMTNEFNKDDNKYFSHAVTRLHTAETLFDALCYVTDVPEKFAGFALGTRAVQLPDGEANHPFLKTFGQPARELACECERESDSNLAQALQLINGPAVNDRLRNPNNRIGKLLAAKKSDTEVLNDLFLVSLSRTPTAGESSAMLEHVTLSLLGVSIVAPKAGQGAEIDKLAPDSPAAKAGLKAGDVLRKLDGAAFAGPAQLIDALAKKTPGAALTITVYRGGQDVDVKATLGADKRRAWEDVHWALINSKEFLFRH